MDTQQLISQLIQMKSALDGQSEAIGNALGILNNTLATQAIDLEAKYQSQIDALTAQVGTLTTENEALTAPVTVAAVDTTIQP